MRLLLLLSALLSALAGVAGGGASARPVTASIAVPATATRVAAVRAAPAGVVAVARWTRPAVLPLPRALALVAARPLFGERRRE